MEESRDYRKMIKESIQITISMFVIWMPEASITSNLQPKVTNAQRMDTKIWPNNPPKVVKKKRKHQKDTLNSPYGAFWNVSHMGQGLGQARNPKVGASQFLIENKNKT